MRRLSPLLVVLALSALAGCDASGPSPEATLRVMTWSLDRGADLDDLDDASGGEASARVAAFYTHALGSDPTGRAVGAARAIAEAVPDVVALQEVMTFRSQFPSDWRADEAPNAATVRLDVLPVLLDSLRAFGAPYTVASEAVAADWERPARFGSALSDVRVTERVVVLVREGVAAGEGGTLPLPPRALSVAGAYVLTDAAAATVEVRGTTIATFRLDAGDSAAGVKAAALARDIGGSPLLIAAHVGSDGPGSAASAFQEAGFSDAWLSLVGASGPTCCRTPEAAPSQRRADLLAARGDVLFLDVERLNGRTSSPGGSPASRTDALFADLLLP